MSMFWTINRHILSWYQISSRVSHYSSCIYATVQDKNFHLFPNRHSQCSLGTKPCHIPNEDIPAYELLFIVMTILFQSN